MFKILDRYILKGFLPLLLMTFLISWFIVLMQFLWRYVDELVGKGLSTWVIFKTLYYAAMSALPTALPLGILLASLMFFGQLGERLELLAMKSSGLPLYRIMRPILLSVVALGIGLFVFQNTYMITSQVRMWTYLFSARMATPELEIPEGIFYNGIPGYSIYAGKRDKAHTGRMLDIMLYDHQAGNERTRIIRADSGRLTMDAGQTYLTWKLYSGQSFENLTTPETPYSTTPTAYAKEQFKYKEIVIPFDANFKVNDEKEMSSRFVGKDLEQLNLAIDTASMTIDSIRSTTSAQLNALLMSQRYSAAMPSTLDTTQWAVEQRKSILGSDTLKTTIRLDSLMARYTLRDSLDVVRMAQQQLATLSSEAQLRLDVDKSAYYEYRTNRQEWHRKFTFPVACIVFFFIGAPLGAIVRKGGIGMPVIIAVLFFVVYYIIDTFGVNMVRSEKMDVALGMWLSTLVLLPVGAVLTWQATRDSASLNTEAYVVFFRRIFGLSRVRKFEVKEMIIEEADYGKARHEIDALIQSITKLRSKPWVVQSRLTLQDVILERWIYEPYSTHLSDLSERLEAIISELSYTKQTMLITRLMDMPMLSRRYAVYRLESRHIALRVALGLINLTLPISLPLVWMLHSRRKDIARDLEIAQRLLGEIRETIDKQE